MTIGTPEEIKQLQKTKTIGIIGLGDMGLLYAQRFSEVGWHVVGCDREESYNQFKQSYGSQFEVMKNGHYVSRLSDYIIYSVEAENIDKIVATYGASTKVGAIVGGQTSCKSPEIAAFEKHLPQDVEIITVHSLHGPNVSTIGQPLVIINYRGSDESLKLVESLMSCLQSKHVYLTYQEHDRITADTQAVTHAAFLSMGLAWRNCHQYPWEAPKWTGGLENAKINISLRIYSNKYHVYAGVAITNPSAHAQITQYAKSCEEIFTLMIQSRKHELIERIMKAKQKVFGHLKKDHRLLLDDDLLEQYSLSNYPPGKRQPNSQLSLLAIVDSWSSLGIVPYDHIICSTPLFRILLGVTEYLFCTSGLLEDCLEVAVDNTDFRQDDLNFVLAAKEWSSTVSYGDYNLYRIRFEKTQKYFEHMFPEANKVGNEMIRMILKRVKDRE
ncbi:prephenate dehydrogenase (NADP(+)) [Brettanomyces nanus]|uniref:Prephenate dehydrogenase [NADP(+)] n=1 Tax=Eeniella nana TaxID=13502 RepID=A0A875S0M4_EENNA|nr:prephenate dehydrogenase (NADP(+)) [Brettanomyces nanus]QPG74518.1 prephenate dehydrogenase (NADP(+)) [Brettanomyces nanus]